MDYIWASPYGHAHIGPIGVNNQGYIWAMFCMSAIVLERHGIWAISKLVYMGMPDYGQTGPM